MAINKLDFLAGYSLFYESARYGGDFMAAIENNRDFSLSENNRDFPLSQSKGVQCAVQMCQGDIGFFSLSTQRQPVFVNYIAAQDITKKETSFEVSLCEMECGGRDSNSHRLTPTTPSK